MKRISTDPVEIQKRRTFPKLLGLVVLCAGVYVQASTKTGDLGIALIITGALWVIVNVFLGRKR